MYYVFSTCWYLRGQYIPPLVKRSLQSGDPPRLQAAASLKAKLSGGEASPPWPRSLDHLEILYLIASIVNCSTWTAKVGRIIANNCLLGYFCGFGLVFCILFGSR